MRTARTAALLALGAVLAPMPGMAATCHHAYLAEGQAPPAFAGISTTEPGFCCTWWGWGASPTQHGSAGALLVDGGGGVAIANLLWANAAACSGQVAGTAVLVEAETAADGGKVALVALLGAEVQVDPLQAGTTQSVAQTIPRPTVSGLATGSDAYGPFVDARLSWSPPSGATWALSTVPTAHAGYGVWVVTTAAGGPVSTGDRSLFARVGGAAGSAPYVVDDPDTADGLLPAARSSCVVRLRLGEVYYLALSLILDGSAATTGDPQADPSAVETVYVSACSQAVEAASLLFADGFESGTTAAWAATVP